MPFDEDDFYDFDVIHKWVDGHGDVIRRAEAGELVVVDDFLPSDAARHLRQLVRDESDWSRDRIDEDIDNDDVAHEFEASTGPATSLFTRVAMALASRYGSSDCCDALYPSFTASRYSRAPGADTVGDRIDIHDDFALSPVELANGECEWNARRFAGVLYLTDDVWTEADGGCFVDHNASRDDANDTGTDNAPMRRIVPAFNRFVAFAVPRRHAVEPVRTTSKKRHAIFGWWYAAATDEEINAHVVDDDMKVYYSDDDDDDDDDDIDDDIDEDN